MANGNPHHARAAKRRKRQQQAAGTLPEARQALWRAISSAEDVLASSRDEPALTLRAVHALTQSIQSYVRVVEAVELEARVQALEERLDEHQSETVI